MNSKLHASLLASLSAPVLCALAGTASAQALASPVVAPAPSGRVVWRAPIDSSLILHRPALGPDGTVYVNDIDGILHALRPDGTQRWTFDGQGQGAQGPTAVGADGTVYFVADPVGTDATLHAVNPDGTSKWTFVVSGSQGVIAGPNIAPSGEICIVTDFGGPGVVAVTPAGRAAWTQTGTPAIVEFGQIGAEIVFGPSLHGGPVDSLFVGFNSKLLYAFRLVDGAQRFAVSVGSQTDPLLQPQAQPAVAADGSILLASFRSTAGWGLESFDPDSGALEWRYAGFPANGMSMPTTNPNGTSYLVRSLSRLVAVDAVGDEMWEFFDGGILHGPILSPNAELLLAGGAPGFGQAGFFRAFSPAGTLLWQVDLPSEDGGHLVPNSRARFSLDGSRAYLAATNPSGKEGAPSWVYALRTNP